MKDKLPDSAPDDQPTAAQPEASAPPTQQNPAPNPFDPARLRLPPNTLNPNYTPLFDGPGGDNRKNVIGVPEVPATPAVPTAAESPTPEVPASPAVSPPVRRKSLTEIMRAGDRDCIQSMWATTPMAAEFAPLPAGAYNARIIAGNLDNSQKGTPGYKLTFQVLEGKYRGRQFWADLWLTPRALPGTKRDLAKLGIISLDQLERPMPSGIVCKVNLTLRRNDDRSEHNSVKSFTVVRIDPPDVDPFAPSSNPSTSPQLPPDAAGGAS